jgi:hypothetical protein
MTNKPVRGQEKTEDLPQYHSIYSFDIRFRRTPDLEIYPRPKHLMQNMRRYVNK